MFAYNLRFPGQYFDQETGKHYNYFRDYDPSTGRYVESDPVGIFGGLSTFGYVFDNPLAFTDGRGLYATCQPVWTGPWLEAGQSRRNERRSEFTSGYDYQLKRADGPLGDPGPSAGKGPGSMKICASIRMRLSIWRILLISEELDLYGRFSQRVMFRCEETKGCPPETPVTYNEITNSEDRFLSHVRSTNRERDLWKRFDFKAPSPVCLPGIGPLGIGF